MHARRSGQSDAPRGSWMGGVLRRRLRELRAGLGAMPAAAARVWAGWLALGLTLTAGLTAGITFGARAWEPHGLGAWDERTLRWVLEGPMSYVNAITFESPGNLVVLGPLVVGLALLLVHGTHTLAGLSLVAAYVLARAFVFLGWGLWDRARPDLVAEGVASPGLHAFPSGHALLTMSAYGFLGWLWARRATSTTERAVAGLLCGAWLVLIGWARLRLGTHWPSDVLAGWLLGGVWLAFVAMACARGEARWHRERADPPHAG